MVIAMMVLLVLAGLGLIAMRFVRMETASGGYTRGSRNAFHVAEGGLRLSAGYTAQQPDYFHRQSAFNNPAAPTYTFPIGHLARTPDATRLGVMDYQATMSRPRLAQPPALFQVGGSMANRFVFYTYQMDVVGTVNGDPVARTASAGGAAAVKQLRADVRLGPITLNQ